MEKSPYRLKILEKINEYEKMEFWDKDVEDDLETLPLNPDMVDYLREKPFAKLSSFIANKVAFNFYEKKIKNNELIIKDVIGIENFNVKSGAIITCNHFNPFDNYVIDRNVKKYLKKGEMLYKVIREGNFTNFKGIYGYFFRHCNTLPLSSNIETMKKFLYAVKELLSEGRKILIYPEQAMWWNYRKPRPLKDGAFNLAVKNGVPIIPTFITMEDTNILDKEGFFVQAYTLHVFEPIYPDRNKSNKENIQDIKNKNYELWKKTYESFYKIELKYGE